MKRNLKILLRLLAPSSVVLFIISTRTSTEPEKSVLRYIAFALLAGVLVQYILFAVKPGLFKDRPVHPD